jgi:Zn-dependent M28 family amino/carboxypeptidase
MRHRGLAVLSCIFSLLLPIAAPAATVQDIVNQVSQAEYTDFHSNSLYTHSGDNRGYGSVQHESAKTNIYNEFQSLGLSPSLEEFMHSTYTGSNVVATLTGTVHPEQVYLVGAHYDSASTPGADDNASGVAGIVEAARVLSQFEFGCTIKFVAFDLEEKGLWGSSAYAGTHSTDDIRGMISMDMIAFNTANSTCHDTAGVYYSTYNARSRALCESLASSLATYGGIASHSGHMPFGDSDHSSFRNWGSACLIEYLYHTSLGPGGNPYLHTQNDAVESTYTYNGQTYNYIDYAYATNMTRGVVGYLATQAVLVPEPGTVLLLLVALLWTAAIHRRFRW